VLKPSIVSVESSFDLQQMDLFLKESRDHLITFLIWINNAATPAYPMHVSHGRSSYFSTTKTALQPIHSHPAETDQKKKRTMQG
jgi:hypothetical protein